MLPVPGRLRGRLQSAPQGRWQQPQVHSKEKSTLTTARIKSYPHILSKITDIPVHISKMMVTPLQLQKPKVKRRVRFADDAKSWDGKRPQHILLENAVLEFWEATPEITTVSKLLDNKNAKMLLILHRLLLAAVERIKHDICDTGTALITSGDGGKYRITLQKGHVPHLQRLIKHVQTAHNSAATPTAPC